MNFNKLILLVVLSLHIFPIGAGVDLPEEDSGNQNAGHQAAANNEADNDRIILTFDMVHIYDELAGLSQHGVNMDDAASRLNYANQNKQRFMFELVAHFHIAQPSDETYEILNQHLSGPGVSEPASIYSAIWNKSLTEIASPNFLLPSEDHEVTLRLFEIQPIQNAQQPLVAQAENVQQPQQPAGDEEEDNDRDIAIVHLRPVYNKFASLRGGLNMSAANRVNYANRHKSAFIRLALQNQINPDLVAGAQGIIQVDIVLLEQRLGAPGIHVQGSLVAAFFNKILTEISRQDFMDSHGDYVKVLKLSDIQPMQEADLDEEFLHPNLNNNR